MQHLRVGPSFALVAWCACLGVLAVGCAGDAAPGSASIVNTSTSTSSTSTSSTSTPTTSTATTAESSAGSAATAPASTSTTAATLDCGELVPGAQVVDVGGVERTMLVVAPEAPIEAPVPVIVLFHGFSSTAENIVAATRMGEIGQEHEVIVVAPQGIGSPTGWHIGDPAFGDADFTDRVLDLVRGSDCVDADAIWLAGFSAGSAWTGVYGCSHADGIAGLLMHSGLAPPICPEDASPNLMIVHGTADPVVPFDGGAQTVDDSSVQLDSVPESSQGWAERAGCDPTPVVSQAGERVAIFTWSGCAGGTTVSLQAVDGLGHDWAGGVDAPDVVNPGCLLAERLAGADGDAALTACR